MALPAFTIHTAVKQAGRQFAKSRDMTVKRWGPTAVGISLVPALPYLFDHPVSMAGSLLLQSYGSTFMLTCHQVEYVVEQTFGKVEEAFFRKSAVPSSMTTTTTPNPDKREL